MKKRYNVDGSRLRRMKKMKITERISESAYTFLKCMLVWTVVLLVDFILEFRLEYLWPCWLFFGSVYTTFHCHGLVICVVFVCAAFTLDVFCLIFVPLHWLFFVASTYVLFNYIWHTEKGLCISTVSLWVLLVYTEASLRLKDLKNSHASNLSHLFAAHCIGYPVVYLGFDATCYFTSVFRLRTQKAVQSDNDFHMHLLQHSLPPVLQLTSRWRSRFESSSSEYQCANGTVVVQDDSAHSVLECLQIHSQDSRAPPPPPPDSNNRRTSNSASSSSSSSSAKPGGGASESREHPHPPHHPSHSGAAGGGGTPPESSSPEKQESPPQEEQGGRGGTRSAKSPSSPKARRSNNAASVPSTGTTGRGNATSTASQGTAGRGNANNMPSQCPAGRTDKLQRAAAWKALSPNRDPAAAAADRTTAAQQQQQQQQQHAEQISKLDQDVRRLRAELQSSRQSEQELRSHMNNLTNSERSLRPELSLLRQSNTLLHNKIVCLSKSKQKDKQTSAMLEKKTRAETEARLSAERQLSELQQHKVDEAASSARSLANRQEQSETLMLRKRVKDLETEYKQLQLDCQGKEGRVLELESDVEALEKYRCVEQETDMLLSRLSALQEKAQHLEYNLSAETRIKLDLFSALGDARRQLEIQQGKVARQDREIVEMKKKIADVMAVTPGMSYMTPQSHHVPQYLTKLLNSERYMLNPRALMYQCLKK